MVHQLDASERVDGVTSLDDQVFLLLADHIDVYSTTDHEHSHSIAVPGLVCHKWNDLNSCELNRCLYVSDCEGTCVRKVGLEGSSSTWPLSSKPRGLSVSSVDRSLLVTCVGARKLIKLNAVGQVMFELSLRVDIELPWHAIQLVDDQFLVGHGLAVSSLHRLCVVDTDGQIVRSHGGSRGSDIDHFNVPCHLAIDKRTRSIFVADYCNRRVTQLGLESLQFVQTVIDHVSSEPRRLHINHATRCLYVAIADSVCVLQLGL